MKRVKDVISAALLSAFLIIGGLTLLGSGVEHSGESIAHIIEEHVHSASMVYPTLANGETATAGAQWVLSAAFEELIPNAAISNRFDIHYVSIEAMDTVSVYELVLYAVEAEIGRVRFVKNANLDATQNVRIQTEIQPAGTQIQFKIACDDGGGGCQATASVFLHLYK